MMLMVWPHELIIQQEHVESVGGRGHMGHFGM